MKKLLAAMLAASLLLLTACGGGAAPEDTGISYDTLSSIKQHVEDGLGEVAPMVSSVTVVESSEAVQVTVRTVAVGGSYLAPVASVAVPLAVEKVEELGEQLGTITISEYTKGNSGEISNMIVWKTKDGETGTFTDDSGDSPVIETGVTIEDLAAMFE